MLAEDGEAPLRGPRRCESRGTNRGVSHHSEPLHGVATVIAPFASWRRVILTDLQLGAFFIAPRRLRPPPSQLGVHEWPQPAPEPARLSPAPPTLRRTPNPVARLCRPLERLGSASSVVELVAAEADAAASYWTAWAPLPIRFAARDVELVPSHWRTFGGRASAITGQPRAATNPANAMLNYLYALLESEATLAARIAGLDPGLGIFHVDAAHRASMAADLMEPVRPIVDRYLLGLLATRVFGARDFFETRTGVCRVTPDLAHELAAPVGSWERLVLPIAQEVARTLLG